MSRGIYLRTSEMKTGKCESAERRIEVAKNSWKDEKVRQKRIKGMKLSWELDKVNGGRPLAGGKGVKRGPQSEETKEKRMKWPILKNRDWLVDKYINKKLLLQEIATCIGNGCSYEPVRWWLHKHDIPFKDTRSEKMRNGGAAYMNSCVKNPSWPQLKTFFNSFLVLPNPILNYPIRLDKRKWYSADIADPRLGIVIEYDGFRYHRDRERDNRKTKDLIEEGWKVIRYKDHIPSSERILADIGRLLCEH